MREAANGRLRFDMDEMDKRIEAGLAAEAAADMAVRRGRRETLVFRILVLAGLALACYSAWQAWSWAKTTAEVLALKEGPR